MTRKALFVLLSLIGISSATVVAQKADSLTKVLDTAQGNFKVKILNELFRAHSKTDPVKALSYAHQALTLATEIDDERGMAAANNNHGVAYRNQGALDKALEYYITSLKLYQKLDNKEGIATTKNNIANIYSIKKDYGQAMHYLEESHAIFTQLDAQNQLIGSMNNLGNLYSDIQLYEKAMKFFLQSYQLSEKAGYKFADPLDNIGSLYFKQGNYQVAVEYYEKALAIERDNSNKPGVLHVVTNLGITYMKAGQSVKAQQYLDEAITLSEELQSFTNLPAVHKARAENFAKQGKMKDAYETQLKYDELREKIHSEESTRNIAQMEMVLDFQEQEKQLDILKKQDEIKSLELKNRNLFIVLIILGAFAVLGVYNWIYLSKKKSIKEKKAEIEHEA